MCTYDLLVAVTTLVVSPPAIEKVPVPDTCMPSGVIGAAEEISPGAGSGTVEVLTVEVGTHSVDNAVQVGRVEGVKGSAPGRRVVAPAIGPVIDPSNASPMDVEVLTTVSVPPSVLLASSLLSFTFRRATFAFSLQFI